MIFTLLRVVVFACLACWGAMAAFAQEAYPSKTVRFIVPWPSGGPADIMPRLAAQRLTETWGKPVIVENRPGATGTIGTDAVVKAAPDGYTLLVTPSQPLAIVPALSRVPYDPLKDLTPVVIATEDTNLLVVNPTLGINTVDELIAAAKANPKKFTFGSSGVGSVGFLCGELMKQVAGFDMLHVPYAGAAQAIAAVVSGEISLNFPPVPQAVSLVKAGKVRPLGVTSTRPSQFLPEIQPLSSHQGLEDLVIANWYGWYGPQKMSKSIVQFLRDSLQKVFQDPAIQQKLNGAGLEMRWEEPDQVRVTMEKDLAKWRKLVEAAHITIN